MRVVVCLLGACALGTLASGLALFACGSSANGGAPPTSSADASNADAGAACPPCVTDNDCAGGSCVQLAAATYCAPRCATAADCSGDRACTPITAANGDQVSACLPRGDLCGPLPQPGPDSGRPNETCGSLVGPDVTAGCMCSNPAGSCAANGCYGGFWCNTKTNRCQQAPTSCSTTDGGTTPGVPYDAGAPLDASIGGDGGTATRLFFAVVGDTRPANIDDTAGYPTSIITDIFSKIAALSPSPPFLVSTGDYMFASTGGGQAAPQLDLYLAARQRFGGIAFPTMGNHECNGFTASNCGPGSEAGVTDNYSQFLTKMLAPIGKSAPYFEVDIDAADASWTSKFLFVAGNAWSDAQGAWLDAAMSRATTYTFIVRHEPDNDNTAPGVTPSIAVMSKHAYTLALVGHTHTYSHLPGSRQIIIGNGGAPITGGKNYGFGMVSQRADLTLDIDMIDSSTGLADSSFHFAVKPDGTPAP